MLIQFAGEIGFASVGLGKTYNRYSLTGMYGIVPHELSGGGVIETIAVRQTYLLTEWNRLSFYGGLNVFHVLGLTYQSEKFKESPKGYYPIGSIRGLLNLGISLNLEKDGSKSFYFESGLNDLWITNSIVNNRSINPLDHASLAIGLKQRF
jgi:hypothetical protein